MNEDTLTTRLQALERYIIGLQRCLLSLQGCVANLQAAAFPAASAGSMALVHVSQPLHSGKES